MKAKLNDPVSKAHSEQFERFVLAVLKVRTSSFYVKNWQYGAFVLRFECSLTILVDYFESYL